MANDPAFLFYDGDAAKDVSHLNRLERGCYFDIIQAQRKFGRLSLPVIKRVLGKDFDECWESVKMCLTYVEDMYFIQWLENSTIKRKQYSESRSKNRSSSKSIEIPSTYDNHMENEIENILVLIRESTKVEGEYPDKFVAMLVLKMIEVFKQHFPRYPVNQSFDYPACLQIAYKIAEMKKWKKADVVNGLMPACLESWKSIVEFASKDEWLCTRSIPDINSDKEWPRLVQKMTKNKIKAEPEKSTAPPLTRLKPN